MLLVQKSLYNVSKSLSEQVNMMAFRLFLQRRTFLLLLNWCLPLASDSHCIGMLESHFPAFLVNLLTVLKTACL